MAPRSPDVPSKADSPSQGRLTVGAMEQSPVVGRVLGTEDATPLEFWVARRARTQYLQLDDVVVLRPRRCPAARPVRDLRRRHQVRARHEGARFDSDVFLIADGVLPARDRARPPRS